MLLITVLFALALAPAQETQEPATPRDSTRLVVTGCLKGRVLTPAELPDTERRGPDVSDKTFRVAGPRALMQEVKKYDRQFVEITGFVKTHALAPQPGFKVGGSRVTIGAPPMSSDPTRIDPRRDPLYNVVVLDATSLRFLSGSCPIRMR